MQSLLQVSEDEIASNFRHAIRMQFLVGSLPLFLSFMKRREENPQWIHLGMCFHIFGRRYPTLPLSSLFFGHFYPDLPWCVMKQLGEIAAEVVDDAVTTTGLSLDALHTP